jgi:hypothetical protein
MIAVLMTLAMAAADVTPAAGPPAATSKEDPNKIRCVRQAPTGTRFEKRVCKTVHEWNRQGKAAQADMKGIQDRTITHSEKGGPGT